MNPSSVSLKIDWHALPADQALLDLATARGGWTGQGTKAGEAWRTRVIYDTNLFTSYSTGRTRQMTQQAKKQ